MKYLQAITNLLGLQIEEPWLTAIIVLSIMFALLAFINLLFRTITRGKEFFSSIINIVLFVLIGLGLYGLGVAQKEKKLEILTFKTDEPSYSQKDEVFFQVKTNKKAFIYIYTYGKDKDRLLTFPRNSNKSNLIPANKIKETDGMNFSQTNSDFTHEQRVILVASTRPLHNAKKVMSVQSFSKMIEDSEDTGLHDIAEKQERSTRILTIPIQAYQAKIKLYLENIKAKPRESFYIDTTSSANGFITVFEGVPTKLHLVESTKVMSDEEMRSATKVTTPLGEHIVVAIYTPQKENITTNGFKVKAQERKGGTVYSLEFKNEPYPYAIREYSVVK